MRELKGNDQPAASPTRRPSTISKSRSPTTIVRSDRATSSTSLSTSYCAVAAPPCPLARWRSSAHARRVGAARASASPDDISLVVADVPADDLPTGHDRRAPDRSGLGRACGAAHHAVADALAPKHNGRALPAVHAFLERGAGARRLCGRGDQAHRRSVRSRAGKAEWVLRSRRERLQASLPQPRKAGPSRRGRAGLQAGLRSRRRPGRRSSRGKAAAKAAAADVSHAGPRTSRHVFDALAGDRRSAHRAIHRGRTGLLLDAAFLVTRAASAAFKKTLTKAAAGLLRDGCRVSLTGPWPPYSFVSLETRSHRG